MDETTAPVDPTIGADAVRVLKEYERREQRIPAATYDPSLPDNLHRLQERTRFAMSLLRRAGCLPLCSRRILEIGCGDAHWLAELRLFGADPSKMAGIDLHAARIERARKRFAAEPAPIAESRPDFRIGNATNLPWPDSSFDLVLQSTVFSSILSEEVQSIVAREILRVLAPGGLLLWYDFRIGNPWNPQLRGISGVRLKRLFPDCEIRKHIVCLAPPLSRWLTPRSWLATTLLSAIRLLNTSYVATIRRS
jgi:SAM-dependent methyltransferase